MVNLGMNERASVLADKYSADAAVLRIAVQTLSTGARVVDAGVNVPGGFAAGLALAELCMGGLGHVEFASLTIGGEAWPGVNVWTDHPAESCMASQYAGWAINPEGFFAMGSGPLRTTARSDMRAIGRTNDCILYGGQARYTVRAEDAELDELARRLPASASADYGTPFYDIFKRYDNDFYKIDPMLFSPAEVWLTSATSGRTFHAGGLDPDVLRMSLFD